MSISHSKLKVSPINLMHYALIAVAIFYYQFISKRSTGSSFLFDGYTALLLTFASVLLISKLRSFSRRTLIVTTITALLFSAYVMRYIAGGGELSNYDFLRSSRFIFILISFLVFADTMRKRNGTSIQTFRSFCEIVFYLAVFMYAIQFVTGNSRPTMFSENNYEVPSILILLVCLNALSPKLSGSLRDRVLPLAAYAASLLSLSKSGVLAASYTYLAHKASTASTRTVVFLAVQISLVAIGATTIISLRVGDGGVESIDRFRFLLVFWDSYRQLGFFDILFGAGLAAPLPASACTDLQFWANPLFDTPGYCNATVFHSFFMKSFYEIGLVGTVLFLAAWLYSLRGYFGRRCGSQIFMIVSIASLSISGFNSSLVMWSLFYCAFFSSIIAHPKSQQMTK